MAISHKWEQEWHDLVAPDEPHKLNRRLDWDCHSKETFQKWLERDPERDLKSSSKRHELLDEAREWLRTHWETPLLETKTGGELPFADIWLPITHWAADKLIQKNLCSKEVINELSISLLTRLSSIGEQVLWQRFCDGRTPGAMLLAHLGEQGDGHGPPIRDHYKKFVHKNRRDGLDSLIRDFPILERLIGTTIALWLESNEEMLERINADQAKLKEKFKIPKSNKLISIKQGLSDPHRGGRVVSILTFGSAKDDHTIKVVYKPKDMRVDQAYFKLIEDINNHSKLEELRSLNILIKESYGYTEFAKHQLCKSPEELKRFYFNAGRITALLHMLGCTDCHHENLIASSDQLILIDTETLLEPELNNHINATYENSGEPQASELSERFYKSVLRSGLMPQWMFIGAQQQAVDISALGMIPPLKDVQKVPGWLGINTDGMMPGRVERKSELPTSLPVGIGADNPFSVNINVFSSGFKQQSEEFIAYRARWLGNESPLATFAGLPRRIVLRNTRVYFSIQEQQLSPTALRSSTKQALKLEQLARSFLLAQEKPLNWPIFASEVRQMQNLDIPFFTHLISGDSLRLDQPGEEVNDFIKTSGLTAAYHRLEKLDKSEIDFQLKLVYGSLAAKQLRNEKNNETTMQLQASNKLNRNISTDGPLLAASKIAERIDGLAIKDAGGQCEWLGMNLGGDGMSFRFGPIGLSLYGGSLGIACLIARLQAKKCAPENSDEIKEAIIRPLKQLIHEQHSDAQIRWWRDQPLGLNGSGGIILGLVQCGYSELAETMLSSALIRFILNDDQLDIIGGCAGLIGPLLLIGSQEAKELASQAGERLVKMQLDNGGWLTCGNREPILGFSHGCAGISSSLAQLYKHCGDKRFLEAAAKGMSYERSKFNAMHGNWPDLRGLVLRSKKDPEVFMTSWCHGAPGIGLSRAALWGTELWDEKCNEEIAAAIQTIKNKPGGEGNNICCGTAGLMIIAQILATGPWQITRTKRALAKAVMEEYRSELIHRTLTEPMSLICFNTRDESLTTPGFFTGLSGIGLGILDDQESIEMTSQLISAGTLSRY